MVYKDGIFNGMDVLSAKKEATHKMVCKDGIKNAMDKAFTIVIDSQIRILNQCNGVADKIRFRFLQKQMLIKVVLGRGWPSKPLFLRGLSMP